MRRRGQGKWRWSHYRRARSVLVAGESVHAYALALEHVRLVGPVDLRVTARYVGGKPVRADLRPAVV
jgi:hypothetical protein